MKNHYFFLPVTLLLVNLLFSQEPVPVPVGSGSYASFPLDEELQFEWEGTTYYNDRDFVYDDPIYVSEGETRPIPTNDWWTNILIEKYGGLLFAYPLVMQPSDQGVKVQYPIGFNSTGTDLDRGNGLLISGDNFNPEKTIAKDWSDWSVVMGMPDSENGTNLDVTMTHGVPFTHFEVDGFNPEIKANGGASYFNSDGTPVIFPIPNGGEFVISSEGRLFGVHLGNQSNADITGKQYFTVDLGQEYSLTSIELNWETAFASGYSIEVSNDSENWTTVVSVQDGDGETDSHTLANTSRYVRIYFQERGTIYAYSLYEFKIFENTTNVALNKTATATSQEGDFAPELAVDGNMGTRWAGTTDEQEKLVINIEGAESKDHFVISALKQLSDLTIFNDYAHNKPIDTRVDYDYDVSGGSISNTWNITTVNLNEETAGHTIQGFIPHHYKNNTFTDVNFESYNYVTSRGELKTAIGDSFTFNYNFGGIIPSFNKPYKNENDANPYQAEELYRLVGEFAAKKSGYGGDTYWGGKDLVSIAKYAVIAKELNHQSYEKIKALSKESLVDWLTYTPGETEKYYARYDRWKALVGFNQSFGSAQFTDNHFHYGYLIYAASLYAMLDDEFLDDYGEMLTLICKQYANWERNDSSFPHLRTFDPWIGHSYAGGTSSANGNNQESTSEAMQSWIGMFLLGEMLGDSDMRDAAAFGYTSEATATLEYWFDWEQENLPDAYEHNMVGILWNGGFTYGTFFSASPVHIHGIQYLPVNPGFKYFAKNRIWAENEYNDMLSESQAIDGHVDEKDFGDDWAHVALGFKLLYNPQYVSAFMDSNLALEPSDEGYIMDYEVSGMTYHYTHAMQNLGYFSFDYRTDFPISSVFEDEEGNFTYAVAYNSSDTNENCNIYNNSGEIVDSFIVPAKTLVTYPELPNIGQEPENCYSLSGTATATSGNNTANSAVDGNPGTRWIAESTDESSLDINLGILSEIEEIKISWDTASAKDYDVLGSEDNINWTLIESLNDMPEVDGVREDVIDNISSNFQYLRILMKTPTTVYHYSIYEIDICGGVATLDIDNQDFLKGFKLYPNPSNDGSFMIQAQGLNNDKVNISIHNMLGHEVFRQTFESIQNGILSVEANNLAAGFYFVNLQQEKRNITAKLIIK